MLDVTLSLMLKEDLGCRRTLSAGVGREGRSQRGEKTGSDDVQVRRSKGLVFEVGSLGHEPMSTESVGRTLGLSMP